MNGAAPLIGPVFSNELLAGTNPVLTDWHDLFVATSGASAALAGLIIVALSVNIHLVIEIPGMSSRAGASIACIVLILYASVAALVPDQSLRRLGIEIALGTLVLLVISMQSAILLFRVRGEATPASTAAKAALTLLPGLVIAVGSGLLCGDSSSGLNVVVAGMLLGFVLSIVNTWVLMVEILR